MILETGKIYLSKNGHFIVQIIENPHAPRFGIHFGKIIKVRGGDFGLGKDYWKSDGTWRDHNVPMEYDLGREITKEEFPELFL